MNDPQDQIHYEPSPEEERDYLIDELTEHNINFMTYSEVTQHAINHIRNGLEKQPLELLRKMAIAAKNRHQ